MDKLQRSKITRILNKEKDILFAYLYGSFLSSNDFRDIDIAVYLKQASFGYVADLKIKIAKALNKQSNFIDITALNGILDSPDAFSLLYLERVLKEGDILVKRNAEIWSNFIEEYSNKSRSSAAMLQEAR